MDNGNLLSLVEENSYRKHNENIADFTDRAIKQSKKLISEIDAIAISIGPGSFTGLRIGLGFAKGLAFSQGIPIIPVPTLLIPLFAALITLPPADASFAPVGLRMSP